MIIVHTPPVHNVPRLGKAQEQLAVEALDVTVLPGRTKLDEQRPDLTLLWPLLDGLRREATARADLQIISVTGTQNEKSLESSRPDVGAIVARPAVPSARAKAVCGL